jgi:hypothetical protein
MTEMATKCKRLILLFGRNRRRRAERSSHPARDKKRGSEGSRKQWPRAALLLSRHAEGDLLDHLFAEAVMEAFENLAAAPADDFFEPHVAVHVDEERAADQADRLGVPGDGRVQQAVPDFEDLIFCFLVSTVRNCRDEVFRS